MTAWQERLVRCYICAFVKMLILNATRMSGFRVAFSSVSASAAVSVITDDIESLFDILAEAKRLIAAAGAELRFRAQR